MGTTFRRYKLLQDFEYVNKFLRNNYSINDMNGYLLQPFWEYAHTHPYFEHKLTPRMGLWENDNGLIGIACYEMNLGEVFLCSRRGCEGIKQEMLEWAEQNLSVVKEDMHELGVWITDTQNSDKDLLESNGYKTVWRSPVRIFSYENKFVSRALPAGFSVISLEDENEIKKIGKCLWEGFDHGPYKEDDDDNYILMQSGPNFRKDLATVIKAPNGDYACYAGMWIDDENKFAYLEPLCTTPEYRKMGLAAAAIAEGIRKTKVLGMKYMFGGEPEFYNAIGFETVMWRELMKKVW